MLLHVGGCKVARGGGWGGWRLGGLWWWRERARVCACPVPALCPHPFTHPPTPQSPPSPPLQNVPLRRMLWWAMVLGVVLGSSQLVLVSGLNR